MANIDLDSPRWDQSTYSGRAKHFLRLTNPLNVLATDSQLDEAKRIVEEFRKTKKLPHGYDEEKLWATKYLYDSAFHPDTGEKMIKIGRMSAQAPMNTIVTGCMVAFYQTRAAIAFWQWVNQSFNALVNYTNRSGDAPITVKQLLASYCAACGGALSTALYLNSKTKTMKPLYARLVPFAAVAAANFINIPMMRSQELLNGTPVFTPDGQRVGDSKTAARNGILLVCISRVAMAVPGMTLVPVITNSAVKRGVFRRFPMAVVPFQLCLVGLCVTFATPMCCAFFDQRASLSVSQLDPELKIRNMIVMQMTSPGMHSTQAELIFREKRLVEIETSLERVSESLVPILTNVAVRRGMFCSFPMAVIPFQLFLVGLCVTFATPLGCAFFSQRAKVNVDQLDPELKESVTKKFPKVTELYYNKGL